MVQARKLLGSATAIGFLCMAAVTARAEWFSDRQNKMGTRVEVHVWHDDREHGRRLIEIGMAEFDRIEAAMSTYIADSELSRVNATAARRAVEVSTELFRLIERSLALSALTDGAFDITYDSVGQHYDYRAGRRPEPQELDGSLPSVGYRLVRLDPGARTVGFARHGVRLNLGGIAKGHAIESVIARLRAAGVRNAMASAGGDTRILGDREGQPWVVGLRDPDDESGIVTRLGLVDEAISTSGDYERYFVQDGVRYHHILDPATGKSAAGIRSATVVGPDAVMTDGLSTAVFVLGTAEGLALIESMPDYEAVVIDDQRRVRFSSGLAPPEPRRDALLTY